MAIDSLTEALSQVLCSPAKNRKWVRPAVKNGIEVRRGHFRKYRHAVKGGKSLSQLLGESVQTNNSFLKALLNGN